MLNQIKELADRQLQIISLAREGLSNKEIGSLVGVKESTIKNAFTEIFQKLRVENRVEAIKLLNEFAYGGKLLNPKIVKASIYRDKYLDITIQLY